MHEHRSHERLNVAPLVGTKSVGAEELVELPLRGNEDVHVDENGDIGEVQGDIDERRGPPGVGVTNGEVHVSISVSVDPRF